MRCRGVLSTQMAGSRKLQAWSVIFMVSYALGSQGSMNVPRLFPYTTLSLSDLRGFFSRPILPAMSDPDGGVNSIDDLLSDSDDAPDEVRVSFADGCPEEPPAPTGRKATSAGRLDCRRGIGVGEEKSAPPSLTSLPIRPGIFTCRIRPPPAISSSEVDGSYSGFSPLPTPLTMGVWNLSPDPSA